MALLKRGVCKKEDWIRGQKLEKSYSKSASIRIPDPMGEGLREGDIPAMVYVCYQQL